MAGSTESNVVGTAPISFTDSNGAQRSVPLSALQYSGSTLQLVTNPIDWAAAFNLQDQAILLAVAKARAAAGELTAPPIKPPGPAIAVTATHPGPESNNISVSADVTGDLGHPMSAKIKFSATETDTYTGLSSAADAVQKIGVDTPPAGTGLVVVKSGTVTTAGTLPVDHPTTVLTTAGFDVQDASSSTLFTLVPRADYSGSDGLSVAVALDPSGTTFTITATYDSTAESGTQQKVTVLTLNALPQQVAYLVTASAPPGGAMLPAAGTPVQLSGGGPGAAASGLFYTS